MYAYLSSSRMESLLRLCTRSIRSEAALESRYHGTCVLAHLLRHHQFCVSIRYSYSTSMRYLHRSIAIICWRLKYLEQEEAMVVCTKVPTYAHIGSQTLHPTCSLSPVASEHLYRNPLDTRAARLLLWREWRLGNIEAAFARIWDEKILRKSTLLRYDLALMVHCPCVSVSG
jgi:hypothetical protein